jgi:hypothetical protein
MEHRYIELNWKHKFFFEDNRQTYPNFFGFEKEIDETILYQHIDQNGTPTSSAWMDRASEYDNINYLDTTKRNASKTIDIDVISNEGTTDSMLAQIATTNGTTNITTHDTNYTSAPTASYLMCPRLNIQNGDGYVTTNLAQRIKGAEFFLERIDVTFSKPNHHIMTMNLDLGNFLSNDNIYQASDAPQRCIQLDFDGEEQQVQIQFNQLPFGKIHPKQKNIVWGIGGIQYWPLMGHPSFGLKRSGLGLWHTEGSNSAAISGQTSDVIDNHAQEEGIGEPILIKIVGFLRSNKRER